MDKSNTSSALDIPLNMMSLVFSDISPALKNSSSEIPKDRSPFTTHRMDKSNKL